MKIRDRLRDIRIERKRGATRKTQTATAQAIRGFKRHGQTWSYDDGHVFVDGYDVNELISDEDVTVSTLIGLASGIGDYKQMVQKRPQAVSGAPKFIALVDALLERILRRVKRVYDDKMFGMSWQFRDNELIVNNVNITSFLALYRVRKTDKARRFLQGLQQKIDTLIANPSGNMSNERARHALLSLKREIDDELEKDKTTAMVGRMLPSGDRRR